MPCLLLLASAVLSAAEPVFPALAELPPGTTLEDPASVRIVGDAWHADGRPRFLVGVQIANTYADSLARTAGYAPAYDWIYDRPLDAESARRLGIDAVSHFTSDAWISGVDPAYRSYHHGERQERTVFGLLAAARLPIFPDYTLGDWSNGALATRRMAGKVPAAALNVGGYEGDTNHWVPYSATTPEGRALYQAMWRKGAEDLVRAGRRAALYELFNEPGYDDPSPANRALFAERLAGRYGSIGALNQAWGSDYADFAAVAAFERPNRWPGLQAEWGRFMEERFVSLCRLGIETIRAVDPEARFSVQPMGGDRYRSLPSSNVNLVLVNALMDVVSTGTGGGVVISGGLVRPAARVAERPDPDNGWMDGVLHRLAVRALAEGKPIQDSEAYPARSGRLIANTLWLELLRGGDAAFLFQWDKRAWDPRWKPAGSEAGGRTIAKHFPWLMLNPFATPTEALTGMMTFRREQLATRDFFLGRRHFRPAEVAVLVSLASERIAPAVGTVVQHEVRRWAAAATLGHFGVDALFEGQLDRLDRYRAVVVAGADYADPATVEALGRFARSGGTVVLVQCALAHDGLGRLHGPGVALGPVPGGMISGTVGVLEGPLAVPEWFQGPLRALPWRDLPPGAIAGWEVLAALDGRPAVLERRTGAGRVVAVNARLGVNPAIGLLGAVLARGGIHPQASARSWTGGRMGEIAPNVEVRATRRDGLRGWMLFNWDRHPKLVALAPGEGGDHARVIDPIGGRALPVVDGRCLVPLQAYGIAAVIEGVPADLAGFGFDPAVPGAGPGVLAQEVEEGPVLEEAPRAGGGLGQPFPCAASRCSSVDLRRHANRSFVDRIAGDGQGGWTDQGRDNSLDGVPFGSQRLLGVPMEIIRFDENADRTCLVVEGSGAPIAGIPVERPVRALYFLHASAWSKPGQAAMTYRIRHADGLVTDAPVRCDAEIGDWWTTYARVLGPEAARLAWFNEDRKGLFLWRWVNPRPEVPVAAIDVLPGAGQTMGMVVAITAEEPGPALPQTAIDERLRSGAWRTVPWLGVVPSLHGNDLRVELGPAAKEYAGVALRSAAPDQDIVLPEDPEGLLQVRLEVDGLPNAFGSHAGGQRLQIGLGVRGPDGGVVSGRYQPIPPVDVDERTLETRSLPLALLLERLPGRRLCEMRIQFRDQLPGSGVRVRRIVVGPEP